MKRMQTLAKKFPLFESSPRLAVFSGISLLSFAFSFLLFASIYLLPHLLPVTETAIAQSPKWTPPTGKSMMEVHIANNGLIFLQGAKVESITGKTIIVSTFWNLAEFKWTIQTDESYYGPRHFGTSFLDSKGKNISITDIKIGDNIVVSGNLNPSYKEPTIKADVVRIP